MFANRKLMTLISLPEAEPVQQESSMASRRVVVERA